MDSKANTSEKYGHIAVILLLLVLFGFLGIYMVYNHYKDPQAASKVVSSTRTTAQEVHGVIRQITTCLTDEKAAVGKPLKHIDNVSTTEKDGYFIASFDGIGYFNASGDYMLRALHCQASVK